MISMMIFMTILLIMKTRAYDDDDMDYDDNIDEVIIITLMIAVTV